MVSPGVGASDSDVPGTEGASTSPWPVTVSTTGSSTGSRIGGTVGSGCGGTVAGGTVTGGTVGSGPPSPSPPAEPLLPSPPDGVTGAGVVVGALADEDEPSPPAPAPGTRARIVCSSALDPKDRLGATST